MEHWRPAVTANGRRLKGYEVSDLGRVRSLWSFGPGRKTPGEPRMRTPVLSARGNTLVLYLRVAPARYATYSIHDLVAGTFLGKRPSPGHVVIHRNHRFMDNRAANLAWVTRSEAALHAIAIKPRRPLAILTPANVRSIRRSSKAARELADWYGVNPRAIYNIRWGKSWRDVT